MSALIVALNPDSDNNGDLGGVGVYNVKAVNVTETGTSATIGTSHYGKTVFFSNASAIAATLPNNAPEGTQFDWVQDAAGAVTFSAASGATRQANGSKYKSNGQYSGGTWRVKSNSNGTSAVWYGFGNLTT